MDKKKMNNGLIMMGAWAIVISTTAVAISGCGGSEGASVHGKLVRSDGAPLAGARVIVRSQETGESAYDTTDPNGEFRVAANTNGLSAGDYDVLILEDLGEPDRPQRPAISPKYRNPARSGLRIHIDGNQRAELNLTLDPP